MHSRCANLARNTVVVEQCYCARSRDVTLVKIAELASKRYISLNNFAYTSKVKARVVYHRRSGLLVVMCIKVVAHQFLRCDSFEDRTFDVEWLPKITVYDILKRNRNSLIE